MSIFGGIVVFVIIWWLVLFTVLPWKANPSKDPGKGHSPSAPARPMLLRKALITTAISLILFAIVFVVVDFDLINFRRMSGEGR